VFLHNSHLFSAEEDTRQRFSWEWISNMGENPTIPDTALRGMKWPVTVRRSFDELSLSMLTRRKLGTSEEAMAARRLMASIIRFDFSIEVIRSPGVAKYGDD
jgi:hypothetical protein